VQRIAAGALILSMLAGCVTPASRSDPPAPADVATAAPTSAGPPAAPPLDPDPTNITASSHGGTGGVHWPDLRVPGGIQRHLWKVAVIHHSDSPYSTPQSMDTWHRQRGWDSLGYDFVIGNGVNYPDGKLYIGSRWREQKTGAHCKTGPGRFFGVERPDNYFNEHGVGICLIGDFEHNGPTPRQLRTLRLLLDALMRETDITPAHLYGHGEVTHQTACPGRRFDLDALRQSLAPAGGRLSPWNEIWRGPHPRY
jgi:hypothetical protein